MCTGSVASACCSPVLFAARTIMLLYPRLFWHLNVNVVLGERLLLWAGVPQSWGTPALWCVTGRCVHKKNQPSLALKISVAHGHEGPVCSWLKVMGALYEKVLFSETEIPVLEILGSSDAYNSII